MAIIDRHDFNFPKDGFITFKGKEYKADYLIKFPTEKDEINLINCTCIFSILERTNFVFRQYVGARFFENLNNNNVTDSINGYLPELVFCFTHTDFPLDDFIKESNFNFFGQKL